MVDDQRSGRANRQAPRSGPLLCPGCRRLISADEPRCPHCGLPAPGARWKQLVLKLGLVGGERLIGTIIGVNAAMYLFSILLSRHAFQLSGNPLFFLSPDSQALLSLGATGTIPIDGYHRWWTLISASYLHAGILHIAFNMLALRQIGPLIIREFGTHRMFIVYTLGGVIGYLVSYLAGVGYTIGASAAVCGLIGAALYYGKSRGGSYGQAVYRQVGGWAISIALFGMIIPGINNWAHGGGMLAGILLAWLMGYQERRPATVLHRLVAVLCMAATAAVLSWTVAGTLLYHL